MRRESIDMPLLEAAGGTDTDVDAPLSLLSSEAAAMKLPEATSKSLKNGVSAAENNKADSQLAQQAEMETEEKKEEEGKEEESLKDVNNDLEMSSDDDSGEDTDLADTGDSAAARKVGVPDRGGVRFRS
jgi:hypothetical protein